MRRSNQNRVCLDDAAYLLGALPPDQRAAYEAHLPGCPSCVESLAQLSGLPGLLRRVPPEVVDQLECLDHDPELAATLPPDVVPGRSEPAPRHARRRRRWLVAAPVAAAASLLLVVAVVAGLPGQDPSPGPPADEGRLVTLTELNGSALSVSAQLTPVRWGTRIRLLCSSDDPASSPHPEPPSYSLLLRGSDGETEQAASWRSLPGRDLVIDAATALSPADIAQLEVRTPDGELVLRGST